MADNSPSQPPEPPPYPPPWKKHVPARRRPGPLNWRRVDRSSSSLDIDDFNVPIGSPIELSIDLMKKEEPDEYQLVLKLCKMALTHHQKIHGEEAYEFESLQEVLTNIVEYTLTFRAKKCNGSTVATFRAVGQNFPGEELKIAMCNKLEIGWIELMKKENPTQYQRILHLCKVALTCYQDNHPGESYEFESLLEGYERWTVFTLTFCAKNTKANGNPLETFLASGYHLTEEELKMGECKLLR